MVATAPIKGHQLAKSLLIQDQEHCRGPDSSYLPGHDTLNVTEETLTTILSRSIHHYYSKRLNCTVIMLIWQAARNRIAFKAQACWRYDQLVVLSHNPSTTNLLGQSFVKGTHV